MALYSTNGHISRLAYSYLSGGEAFIISKTVPAIGLDKLRNLDILEYDAVHAAAITGWAQGFRFARRLFEYPTDWDDDEMQYLIQSGCAGIIRDVLDDYIRSRGGPYYNVENLIPTCVAHEQINILNVVLGIVGGFESRKSSIESYLISSVFNRGSFCMLKFLKKSGAEVRQKWQLFGATVRSGNIRAIKLLIKWGWGGNHLGLYDAADLGHIKAMRLVRKGREWDYDDVLFNAACRGQLEAMKLLKKWGATKFDCIRDILDSPMSKGTPANKLALAIQLLKSWMPENSDAALLIGF